MNATNIAMNIAMNIAKGITPSTAPSTAAPSMLRTKSLDSQPSRLDILRKDYMTALAIGNAYLIDSCSARYAEALNGQRLASN